MNLAQRLNIRGFKIKIGLILKKDLKIKFNWLTLT